MGQKSVGSQIVEGKMWGEQKILNKKFCAKKKLVKAVGSRCIDSETKSAVGANTCAKNKQIGAKNFL